MNQPRPGEVWLADLGLAAKMRPVVIVSRFDPEPPRALITYSSLNPPAETRKTEIYRIFPPRFEQFSKKVEEMSSFPVSTSGHNPFNPSVSS